jgi:probable HAF family extracellular repeat protein
MKRSSLLAVPPAVLLPVLLSLPLAHAQFSFTDLGALPGGGPTPFVTVNGINSTGQVCGGSSFLDTTHAYLWKPAVPNGTVGAMMNLGAVIHPTASNWSICTAVSTFAPVGYGYYPPAMSYRALVFSGEKFIGATPFIPFVLPIPPTVATFVPNSYANAVNDSGVIVGSWTPESGIYHAMKWKPVGATAYSVSDLNSPGYPDWVLNIATGINKTGDIVGYGSHKGMTHAFLIKGGKITDLGSLSTAAFDYSVATGLNDKGQVVGYSHLPTPAGIRVHAFVWKSGTMTDLDVPVFPGMPFPFTNSVASAINNNGKIVGWVNQAPVATPAYEKTPFGWGSAAAFDLNAGATPPGLSSGWNLLGLPMVTVGVPPIPLGLPLGGAPLLTDFLAAFAINDMDQIGGIFLKRGPLDSGFLLTAPLPLKP